jgi:hypothetical protein
MSRETPPEDYCSCAKRDGAWGQGRWHHILVTEEIAEKMAGKEFIEQRKREPLPDDESAELWKEIKKSYRAYIGTKIAYEECLQGLERIRRQCEIESRRREIEA